MKIIQTFMDKCMDSQKNYVTGSDYEMINNEKNLLKIENEKLENLIKFYKKEIESLKHQNKILKSDNSIRI